jgi:NAD(P)H-hydrate epimerase
MILHPADIRALEAKLFARGATSAEELMEEVGARMAEAVTDFFPGSGDCMVFYGKGHNGGDALVLGRRLAERGWRVSLNAVTGASELAELTEWKLRAAQPYCDWNGTAPRPGVPRLSLDGVLGIGATGGLRGVVKAACERMNGMRASEGWRTVALDVPTGLNPESGEADPAAVAADVTLSVAFGKPGFIRDGAAHWTGRLVILPVPILENAAAQAAAASFPAGLTSPGWLRPIAGVRSAESYKGKNGVVAIVAGSRGFVGAGVLAARGALGAGAGYAILHVPEELELAVQPLLPPEVMVRGYRKLENLELGNANGLAIGPGIGFGDVTGVMELLLGVTFPAVVDADALRILGTSGVSLTEAKGERILTPHPGEMEALLPGALSRGRLAAALECAAKHQRTVLLKGARTIIATPGRTPLFNPTGTPAMAKAGMGDLLTGIVAALLAQGTSAHEAAALGAWIHARAAELALSRHNESERSLTPSAACAALGHAWRALETSWI